MTRCALCPGVNVCIPPDGPEDAEVMLIGEAPGKDENRKGRNFIGKTGEEVNRHYLPLAGLQRRDVLVTNAIRCLPISAEGKLDPNRSADRALLESCTRHHLLPLIERLAKRRLRWLVPVGSFAVRAVAPTLNLELHHGLPVDSTGGLRIFPMYHPALGIHEPKRMLYIRTDWHRFKAYRTGTLQPRVDRWAGREDYREVEDVRDLRLDPARPIALDTETARGGDPFCLTYSQDGGCGALVRADRGPLLSSLSHTLQRWQAPVLLHNYYYDGPVLRRMGVHIPRGRVVDTMARVYHLGNLPQGLKALALRELGMQMQEFEEVVKPYSIQLVLDYYRQAQRIEWPKPEPELRYDEKAQTWKMYKPQGMNTKLKRFFTDYGKNPEKDVFESWGNWASEHAAIEERLRPWPGMCVTHAPFEDVLFYACRDADATLRLWLDVIQPMTRRVRRYSQELWRAA